MAGRPLEALALLAIGFRNISMAPASVGPVKSMVLATHLGQAGEEVRALMDAGAASIRDGLAEFARRHDIPV
jgi:phosphotransferase system enzyme I (PtsP)